MSSSTPNRRPPVPRSGLPRWALPALAVTVVIVVALRMAATEPLPGEALEGPPAEVLGRWETNDALYADRALTITAGRVEIDVGAEGAPRGGAIVSVRRWQEGSTPVIRVEYEIPGGTDRFEMLLDPSGSMQLRNPPNVTWTRAR